MDQWPVQQLLHIEDGDTFDVRIDRRFGDSSAMRIRVAFIDTPEVYGPHATARGKDASVFAHQWWDTHRAHDGITMTSYKGSERTIGLGDGEFGRWLGSFLCSCGSDYATAVTRAGLLKNPDGT